MARLGVAAPAMTLTATSMSSVLVLVLVLVASVSAQQSYMLDSFTVAQRTISLSSAGTISSVACTSGGQSSSTLAGGVRKLQITAPSGTNVGNSVQLGVFIPTGQTSAPNGVQSGNNNLLSPTFQILYRLDGDSAACSQTSSSNKPISKQVNNLNINLQRIGAYAFAFTALGDVTPNAVTVTLYSPTGVTLAQSNPISVVETGPIPLFTLYTLNFSDSTKWTSSSRFTGTVGAVELSWPEPANLQFAVKLVEFLVNPTTSIGAKVFVDCGCDGFHAGTGDKLQAGVTVTLSIGGGGGCKASTQTQKTSSSGTVSFIGIPGDCTYTLSVSGLNLCSNSASSQSVPAGGEANFAIQGTASSLVIPPSTTVLCGSDTSPASTGVATIASGTCAGAAASFTDTVTTPQCTPGGSIQVIQRAWSGAGSTQTQTITVTDRKEISVSSWQPNVIIPCDASPTSAPSPSFISCTAMRVAVSTQTSNNCTHAGPCTAVTYKATDQCGNTKSVTQFVVQDCPSSANCRFICDDDPITPPTCSIVDQGSLSITHPLTHSSTHSLDWLGDWLGD